MWSMSWRSCGTQVEVFMNYRRRRRRRSRRRINDDWSFDKQRDRWTERKAYSRPRIRWNDTFYGPMKPFKRKFALKHAISVCSSTTDWVTDWLKEQYRSCSHLFLNLSVNFQNSDTAHVEKWPPSSPSPQASSNTSWETDLSCNMNEAGLSRCVGCQANSAIMFKGKSDGKECLMIIVL